MIHPVDETLRELIVKNIQLLINEGANPNTQDRMGKTPLHLVVNLSTYSRMPNIIASFRKLKADLIQLLLNAGADPNILDRRGLTPFSEAVSLSDNRNYATTPIQLMIDSGKVSYENAHSALQRTRRPQTRPVSPIRSWSQYPRCEPYSGFPWRCTKSQCPGVRTWKPRTPTQGT